ncbi:MAG: D-arabinono-1,4-lactone oxidase [Dehalococcoidia bacterium]
MTSAASTSQSSHPTRQRVTTFDHRFSAEAFLTQPRDVDELRAILAHARAERLVVKAVGAAHSFSDIALSEGYLVNLDHLSQVGEPQQDGSGWTIQVGAGVRLKDLNRALWQRGFALANMGEVAEQSIAGATQTATHGSGEGGNSASGIVAMTLLTAEGRLMRLPNDDPELFRAACVGLGALGIVVDVTLRIQPRFYLEEVVTVRPFDEVVASMPRLMAEHSRVRFRWMPHTKRAQISVLQPTTKRPKRETLDPRAVSRLELMGMNLLTRIGHAVPSFVPLSNRILGLTYLYREERSVDVSFRRFANGVGQLLKPHEEIEYAVRPDEAGRALEATRRLIEQQRLKVNFPVEVRPVPADSNYMSYSYHRDVACIGANSIQGRDANRFFRMFAELMMREFNGLPHLGKDLVGVTPEYLRQVYGDGYVEFRRLREQYDPDGLFANDFVRRLFPTAA